MRIRILNTGYSSKVLTFQLALEDVRRGQDRLQEAEDRGRRYKTEMKKMSESGAEVRECSIESFVQQTELKLLIHTVEMNQ